jgi:nuclear pore complex protein Nup54
MEAQITRIKNAFDPTNPECAFTCYFYNNIPAEQAALYVMPPGQNTQRWEEAIASRPSPSSVPVLAVGFSDLQKRQELQQAQIMQYRQRLHEIHAKLLELASNHDLQTSVKAQQCRGRHALLRQRTLALAARVQVLKGRGFALSADEESLKRRLEEMLQTVRDPAVFGSVNEVWARLAMVHGSGARGAEGTERLELQAEDTDALTDILEQFKNAVQGLVSVASKDAVALGLSPESEVVG